MRVFTTATIQTLVPNDTSCNRLWSEAQLRDFELQRIRLSSIKFYESTELLKASLESEFSNRYEFDSKIVARSKNCCVTQNNPC